jgi:hypothetical protein
MKDYFITCDSIPIFLNPLMRSGIPITFTVTVPLMENMDICEISLNNQEVPVIQSIITPARYKKTAKRLCSRTRKNHLIREIPEYGNFQEAFFNSAVLKPAGLDALFKYIHNASTQSVIKGGDVYYIAFDTNVLRDRIYTNYLRKYSDAPNIDFILAETVRSEMTNRERKISKKMVNDMVSILGETAWNFLNQNVLADRLRYFGFLEYNRIRHETDCDQLKSTDRSNNKDEQIIKSYASFADGCNNRKILLISRDNEFIRMSASLPNIVPIIIESHFPRRIPKSLSCTYDELFSFIYHLAVMYGQINFSVKEHILYECSGLWSQKNVRQWEKDYLKISAHHALPYLDTIDSQIDVLENMKYTKIIKRFPLVQ